jgi:alanyl-tRNA synthetase
MLGVRGDFFWKMVAPLVATMGEAYPELARDQSFVESALRAEEERFGETLEHGMRIFDEVSGRDAVKASGTIPGADAFRLYDTYGFPVDLTADIARERGLSVDMAGFEAAMEQQRETARAAGKFGGGATLPAELASQLPPTRFLGYDALEAGGLEVLAILRDGRPVDALAEGEEGIVLLDATPFYAESGGQVGDTGELAGQGMRFVVDDTMKLAGQFHAHSGRLAAGTLRRGDRLLGAVDAARRAATVLNHSATHLLHAALRQVLGAHVAQKGSLVAPDKLRFDFAHSRPLTDAQRREAHRHRYAEKGGRRVRPLGHGR